MLIAPQCFSCFGLSCVYVLISNDNNKLNNTQQQITRKVYLNMKLFVNSLELRYVQFVVCLSSSMCMNVIHVSSFYSLF